MRGFDQAVLMAISLPFLLFGASKFYPFRPTPPMTSGAARFIGALHGLALLAPVIVNIVLYLVILQAGIGFLPYAMSAFLILTWSWLVWHRKVLWLGLWLSFQKKDL